MAMSAASTHRHDPIEVVVPYQSSISFVAVVAIILSPLATLLWLWAVTDTNANINQHDINFTEDDIHSYFNADYSFHRFLQNDNETSCDVNNNQQNSSIWIAIRTTFYIAFAVACFCLLLYECFRRDPIIGKYVYDRKRLTQPDRTPPPLMLSRSLWQGYDEEEEQGGGCTKSRRSTCFKVLPAILELVFMVLDDNYIRYSHAANEARKAREKQGIFSCCRSGRYHANCCNGQQLNLSPGESSNGDYFVDEDNYMYYAEYSREYSHIYQSTRASLITPQHQLRAHRLIRSWPGSDGQNGEASGTPNKWRHSLNDLFPEDNRRKTYAESRETREKTCRILRAGFDLNSGHPPGQEDELDSLESGNDNDSGKEVELVNAVDYGGKGGKDSVKELDPMEGGNDNGNEGKLVSTLEFEGEEKEDSDKDIKSVNESIDISESYNEFLGNLSSPGSKSNVSFYSAKSGLDGQEGESNPAKDEADKQDEDSGSIEERRSTMLSSMTAKSLKRREGMNAGRIQSLKYPRRLKYFFMPPGFHSVRECNSPFCSVFMLVSNLLTIDAVHAVGYSVGQCI